MTRSADAMSTTTKHPGLFDIVRVDQLCDLLDLAEVERRSWGPRQAALRATGAPCADEAADAAAAAAAEAERAAADAAAARAAEERAERDAELGAGGKAALDAERRARRDAEKRFRDAQARLDAAEAARLSDLDREKRRADDAEAKVSTATEKLRKANLLTTLSAEGIANPKAAAKLLDGVEFDDDDEPTNLQDRLKAAKAEYGDEFFGAARAPRRKPGSTDGGAGNEDREGPTLTADELAAARASGMTPEQYEAFKSPQPDASAFEKKK
jgi:hypothetical protein